MEAFRSRAIQISIALILLAFTAQLTTQAWRANYTFASDQRNPYVYAQTVPDILNLVKRAEGLAAVSPSGTVTL